MALTLANTISATALELEVNGAVPAAIDIGYRFRLDNELLELRAFGRTEVTVLGGAATENVRNENAWVVERGLERTTAASHTSGASILGTLPAVAVAASEVLPAPFAEGGGAPTGDAGGDLSGTYPNPSVVNSSHAHDAATAPGTLATAAAHVVPETATPQQIAEALIAAGLMEAS